jgi:hypothetical protein
MARRLYSTVLLGTACLTCLTTLRGSAAVEPAQLAAHPLLHDRDLCETNLKLIFDAIQEYRKRNEGQWPSKLFDLIPEFIYDSQFLICPAERKTWNLRAWRDKLVDPALEPHTSYMYELTEATISDNVWRGLPKKTHRQAKEREMERLGKLGGFVPIVRCHSHGKDLHLNLAYNGSVYESGTYWELNYAKGKDSEDLLSIGRLFADRTAPRAICPADLPARDPRASPRLLDLTSNYNALLSDSWQGFPSNDLRQLPSRLQQFNDVPFDARGVIQLGGAEATVCFPERIEGIAVRQRFSRIHVLHAATFPPLISRKDLGRYVLRYSNGRTWEIPIVYGKDIADWWFDPNKPIEPSNARVAWTGSNDAVKAYGKSLRIYHAVWDNPLPDVEVLDIRLVSNMSLAAPFLLAITLDP